MSRRHTHHRLPTRWLMTDERMGDRLWTALERIPSGGGVVFRHYGLDREARRILFARVAAIARRRGLILVEAGTNRLVRRPEGHHNEHGPGLLTASAHTLREALAARRHGADLIFVSPVFPTRSHPRGRALGPIRAAAIARIAGLPAIALGGMNARKFQRLHALGFHGWAGIDAWTAPDTAHQKRNAVPI